MVGLGLELPSISNIVLVVGLLVMLYKILDAIRLLNSVLDEHLRWLDSGKRMLVSDTEEDEDDDESKDEKSEDDESEDDEDDDDDDDEERDDDDDESEDEDEKTEVINRVINGKGVKSIKITYSAGKCKRRSSSSDKQKRESSDDSAAAGEDADDDAARDNDEKPVSI
jgi:hypothetical protein